MTTILNGLLGGAIVAVVGTLAAHFVDGEQTTTAGESAPETEPMATRWQGALLQVVYGSVAGGVLVALELFVLGVLAVPPSLGEAFAVAVAWSIVLLVAAVAVWRFLLGSRLGRVSLGKLAVYHLVFGVGFGLWIRLTWIT